MPVDEATGLSKGFAFVEFTSPAAAAAAREQAHGYRLDKAHTFAVTRFDDLARYRSLPSTYEAPPPREFKAPPPLTDWLLDKRGRDQFVVRFGDETEVFWNDAAKHAADPVAARSFWSDKFVLWSPRGSYLATVHRQGVALWGGPDFERLARFAHPGVQRVDFSPGEKFLVTFSAADPAGPRDRAALLLNIFDIRTGRKLRTFEGPVDEWAVGTAALPGGGLAWPLLRWSGGGDDAFCARLARGAVSVYESPTMALAGKKSLKAEGLVDFAWSPGPEPVMATYQAEQGGGNVPARVALVRWPDRAELRGKQLHSVSRAALFWHPGGDFLAVEVSRFTKTRKSTYTGFELFTLTGLREGGSGGAGAPAAVVSAADVPAEVLELPTKTDRVLDFAWEPRGSRFAVLHADPVGPPRPTLSLFDMKGASVAGVRGVAPVGTPLPGQQANTLLWSPAGKFLLLAGLKAMNGQLAFFSADDGEVLSAGEHFMATDAAWDPTGRYVATAVTSVHQMENGYRVWTFAGAPLHARSVDRFYQFLWRPRPPSLLTAEEEAAILKNLKQHSKRFEEEDAALLAEADTAIVAERQAVLAGWREWVAGSRAYAEELAAQRAAILGDRASEGAYRTEEVEVEEVVGVSEEVVKG
jgi:translation initiation factor 3 subunit B